MIYKCLYFCLSFYNEGNLRDDDTKIYKYCFLILNMSNFKVGDKVKVTKGRSSSSNLLDGKIGKIIKVSDDHCCLDIETEAGGLWNEELELVNDPKFTVGDKVRYLGTKEGGDDYGGWGEYFGQYGIKKGSEGIISEITYDGKGIFIKDDGRPTTSGRLFACDIELIKEPEFKIGDRVKATISCSGAVAGEIYELIENEFNSFHPILKGTSCSCKQGWELVIPEYHIGIDPGKSRAFEIGDRIRVKRACSGTVPGKIYTVYEQYGLYARDEELEKEGRYGCSCEEDWELVEDNVVGLDFIKEAIEPEVDCGEDFKNTKVHVKIPEESETVQKRMFELGYTWRGNIREVENLDKEYLTFGSDKNIDFWHTKQFYIEDDKKEVTVQQILKGGKENKNMEQRTLYHVTIIDRRNSEVVTDENVAAVNEFAAILKAVNGDYNEADVDFFHYDVKPVVHFEALEPSNKKK